MYVYDRIRNFEYCLEGMVGLPQRPTCLKEKIQRLQRTNVSIPFEDERTVQLHIKKRNHISPCGVEGYLNLASYPIVLIKFKRLFLTERCLYRNW